MIGSYPRTLPLHVYTEQVQRAENALVRRPIDPLHLIDMEFKLVLSKHCALSREILCLLLK
jgi:hypothetical protein